MKITKDDFGQLVQKKIEEEGDVSLIRAVFQVYTTLWNEERKNQIFSCNRGCCKCCYQLVTCTELEIDEIRRFITLLPKKSRRQITAKFKKFAGKWFKYYEKNQNHMKINMLKPIKDWLGKPCVFLDETKGMCQIYPVRPIDCRTYYSHTKCKNRNDLNGVVRHFYDIDKVVNDYVLDMQNEHKGILAVTPILHWLNLKWNLSL